MKDLFSKDSLINLALWIGFGITSFAAGARFSVNGIAYIGMFIIVITMTLREFTEGLRRGSDIANKIWKEHLDEMFQKLRND